MTEPLLRNSGAPSDPSGTQSNKRDAVSLQGMNFDALSDLQDLERSSSVDGDPVPADSGRAAAAQERILAIDPGYTESAWLLYDVATGMPSTWAKEENNRVRA